MSIFGKNALQCKGIACLIDRRGCGNVFWQLSGRTSPTAASRDRSIRVSRVRNWHTRDAYATIPGLWERGTAPSPVSGEGRVGVFACKSIGASDHHTHNRCIHPSFLCRKTLAPPPCVAAGFRV